MNKLLSLFKTVEYLGIMPHHNEIEVRSLRIVNNAIFFAFLLHLIFIPLFAVMGLWPIVAILFLGFFVILLALFFASISKNKLGLAIAQFFFPFAVTACAYLIKGDLGIEYILMAMIVLPLLCRTEQEIEIIVFFYFLIISSGILFTTFNFTEIGYYEVSEDYQFITKILCLLTFYFYVLSQLLFYFYQTNSMNKSISDQQKQMIYQSHLSDLGLMASGVAHEINNLLTIIQGNASKTIRSLEKEGTAEPAPLYKIKKSAHRINQIITTLKNLAQDGHQEECERVYLQGILEEVLILIKERLETSQIEILVNLPPVLSPIYVKPIQISQVFLNLFSNSYNVIRDQKNPWIEVIAEENEDFIIVSFIDSGEGMKREILERLTVPYFSTRAMGKKSGLGLTIAKGILDDHHATFEFIPEHPFTCFKIKFPKYSHLS